MPGQGTTPRHQATPRRRGEGAELRGRRCWGEAMPRLVPLTRPSRPQHAAGTRRVSALPKEAELLWAVRSLYSDKLKPCSRMLKLRLAEKTKHNGKFKNGDTQRLRSLCERSSELRVEPLGMEDWAVFLRGRKQDFVDVYSEVDCYSEELWHTAEVYFGSLAEGAGYTLPRGRYASAQALMARQLPFLKGFALGQVCHFVQVAISKRKLLGYIDGGIVPYAHSISMAKARCAQQQCPLPAVSGATDDTDRSELAIADWDAAVTTLREILGEAASHQGSPQVQLSNVKRLFRSLHQMELSETALGYATLTELLNDPRFRSICEVRAQGRGHVVVPVSPEVSPTKDNGLPRCSGGYPMQERRDSEHAMCAHEAWPVLSEERRRWSSLPASPLLDVPMTPEEDQSEQSCCDGAFAIFEKNSSASSTTAETLPQSPRYQVFCPDEPLCLEDAEYPSSMLGVQAFDTPSPQLQYTNNGYASNEEPNIQYGEPFVLQTPSPLYDRSACWAWIQEQDGRDGNSPPMSLEQLLRAEGLADYCTDLSPTSRTNYSCTSSNSSTHGALEPTSGNSAKAPETIALSLASMV